MRVHNCASDGASEKMGQLANACVDHAHCPGGGNGKELLLKGTSENIKHLGKYRKYYGEDTGESYKGCVGDEAGKADESQTMESHIKSD